jgi:hypothetical protein
MNVAEEKEPMALTKNHLAWSTALIVRNGMLKGPNGTSIVSNTSRGFLLNSAHR